MGIGLGIILLVLGAIFYFTNLDTSVLNTNLNTVGIILMAAGALAIILALIMNAQRTRTAHTTVVERRGGPDVVERDRGPVERDRVVERDPEVVERRDDY
ncbi:hypothetical protein N864_10515 [Intrasporangium chromatireducens Q5-1]|uniref:DUF6458 domain-containing protein n=1 Tax=Intrasporangium chromatireducens Q5-1 TaxID=584657 RepID=W9GQ57_9MICO|nr:DUF6458 family protein [Intrasporangium chromatireducens]EWT07182.1 hypothetical protein N864_10515 [Intrasporangium chromatireducens Q5-1]